MSSPATRKCITSGRNYIAKRLFVGKHGDIFESWRVSAFMLIVSSKFTLMPEL